MLNKPAVDTDISHLDFPAEEPVCANESCSTTATEKMAVSCGCVHLLCKTHVRSILDMLAKSRMSVGRCKCGAISTIVSITPIHP